jgi:ribosomal protein L3 glutamine methyltransferase
VAIDRPIIKLEESKAAVHTVRDAIRHCTSHLSRARLSFGHGNCTAHDEAVQLVLWCLHLPPDNLEPFLDASVSHGERGLIFDVLRQRITNRTPLAYLTGEAWLAGFAFDCDARALVPRSPIGPLLTQSLDDLWGNRPPIAAIMDMCTGGGSLAIIAAHCVPDAQVVAVDIDGDALQLAQANVLRHGLSQRVQLVLSDGLSKVQPQLFDLVICNPPYVNAVSMAALPAEYRQEPPHALDGGDQGMQFIVPWLQGLAPYLSDHAAVLLEIGHEAAGFEAALAHSMECMYVPVPAGDQLLVWIEANQILALGESAKQRA